MSKEIKIMIMEDSPALCKKYKDAIDTFPNMKLVQITNNVYNASEMTRTIMPEVCILNLDLNGEKNHGMLYLMELKKLSLVTQPYVIILVDGLDKNANEEVRKMGADFIFSKNDNNFSPAAIIEFVKNMDSIILSRYEHIDSEDGEQKENRIKKMIEAELDFIGIRQKDVGYQHLSKAIRMVIDEPPSNLCEEMAKQCNKSASSIERAMQNSINRAWEKLDPNERIMHYTGHVSATKGFPELKSFVYYYANKVKGRI